MCVCVCLCVCVRAYVRAYVDAFIHSLMHSNIHLFPYLRNKQITMVIFTMDPTPDRGSSSRSEPVVQSGVYSTLSGGSTIPRNVWT